jgi:DNA gyrase subunit B
MPQLVDNGHIYIAQPPLYKVKAGREERYLKDELEETQFMLGLALKDAEVVPGQGQEAIRGDALAELARQYALAEAVLSRLSRFMDEAALNAIIKGVPLSVETAQAAEQSAAALLEALHNPLLPGVVDVKAQLDTKTEKYKIIVLRNHHGNIRTTQFDEEFIRGSDYAVLVTASQTFSDLISEGAFVARGEGEKRKESGIEGFGQAMNWLRSEAERGVSKQRYKGLGEMNPEQLWETTMNPEVRRLWRVQIEDAIAADEIFTTLMGDQVEPRRDFIETHALQASNIDI